MIYGLIALAVFPGIGISIYVYRKDLYEKEPVSYALRAFLLGVLSIFPATIGYMLFENISRSTKPFCKHLFIHFV